MYFKKDIKLNFNVLKVNILILQYLKWYFSVLVLKSVLYCNCIVNCKFVYFLKYAEFQILIVII